MDKDSSRYSIDDDIVKRKQLRQFPPILSRNKVVRTLLRYGMYTSLSFTAVLVDIKVDDALLAVLDACELLVEDRKATMTCSRWCKDRLMDLASAI